MKTRWLVAVACVLLLCGGAAFAGSVGNNPDKTGWRWDIGFERSEREVELDNPALFYEYVYEDPENTPDEYYTETYQEWMTLANGRETLDKYFLQAGYGWSDSLDSVDADEVDLLSVLTHEFGHVLGYDHDVMGDTLAVGERDLPGDDGHDDESLSGIDVEGDLLFN